ncbi:MAG: DMT family transporter [Fimbriiglobus sp.]
MNTTTILYAVLAAGAGCCLALQATANSRFRSNLESPLYAAFFSICGTIITATIALAILRPTLPTSEDLRSTQWWNWIGGPLGALIVLAGAFLTKQLGAAVFLSLMIAGQLILSVALDHVGAMGLAQQEITWGRVVGVLLVITGVVCIKYL